MSDDEGVYYATDDEAHTEWAQALPEIRWVHRTSTEMALQQRWIVHDSKTGQRREWRDVPNVTEQEP